jgi:hypothetical protein
VAKKGKHYLGAESGKIGTLLLEFFTPSAILIPVGSLTQKLQQQAALVEPKSVTQVRDFFDNLVSSHK